MTWAKRFEDLEAWQEARVIAKEIFKLASSSMQREYALADQLKRSAVSIMSNIAEGFGRYYDKDFIRFLNIAQSSAIELKSLLYVVLDNGFTTEEEVKMLHEQIEACRSKINGLIRYLNTKNKKT